MGFDCYLGQAGGYLLDSLTGERVPIIRKGNLYVMKLWVKDAESPKSSPSFARQGC